MQKKSILVFLCAVISFYSFAQVSTNEINFWKNQMAKAKDDSARLNLAFKLATGYRFSNVDSSFYYSDLGIKLADGLNLPAKKAEFLSLKGATLLESGKLPESLQFQFEALNISQQVKDTNITAYAFNRIGNTYMELGDYKKAIDNYVLSRNLFYTIKSYGMYYNEISNIGNIYNLMHIADSALYYGKIVYDASLKTNDREDFTRPEIMFRLGNAYKAKGNNTQALKFYKRGVAEAYIDNDLRDLSMNFLLIAKLYKETDQPDSSMKYALNSLQTADAVSFRKCIYEASTLISELFKNNNRYDSAFKYLSKANIEKDSLTGTKRFQELQGIILNEQQRDREIEANRIAVQNKQRQYALLAGLGIVLIIAFILYHNNKQKQKVNTILNTTVTNLKSTQAQLIQSEKMASLGELTAGIAHEIQNPLNFVNNFSEISRELIDELKSQKSKLKSEEQDEILNDIDTNLEKINHHGKRADAIVKGMLQHSRQSSGKKELTDINALCDEYLRLSYHGMRAKEKDFNAGIETGFDNSIRKINIVPQDIGRVLLNLYNNAFYATNEKKKTADENYKPLISVQTKKINDRIEIRVSDNGNGIPKNIVDKIFQPFFTTKPTGQGTGLGLSLSYDIVKAHGGEIKMESKEGEGSEFIIQLPV